MANINYHGKKSIIRYIAIIMAKSTISYIKIKIGAAVLVQSLTALIISL